MVGRCDARVAFVHRLLDMEDGEGISIPFVPRRKKVFSRRIRGDLASRRREIELRSSVI